MADCSKQVQVPLSGDIVLTPPQTSDMLFTWDDVPKCVLVVKKPGVDVARAVNSMSHWLVNSRGMKVFCEAVHKTDLPQCEIFDFQKHAKSIDFCITVGGDGTVLHLNWLFRGDHMGIPPVLSFAMGSLGFLTPFDFDKYPIIVDRMLRGHKEPVPVCLRMRLNCTVYRVGGQGQDNTNLPLSPSLTQPCPIQTSDSHSARLQSTEKEETEFSESPEPIYVDSSTSPPSNSNVPHLQHLLPHYQSSISAPNPPPSPSSAKRISPVSTRFATAIASYQPLNEMLLGRGPNPHMTSLELWIDNEPVTNMYGDGVIISTPTGSTAYSMAAGGPMISPSSPAFLLTPICPHSLSFRPIVLPESTCIKMRIPDDGRSVGWAYFDGLDPIKLNPTDFVHVARSSRPLPSINLSKLSSELLWFKAITAKLHWNIRAPYAESKPIDPRTKNYTNTHPNNFLCPAVTAAQQPHPSAPPISTGSGSPFASSSAPGSPSLPSSHKIILTPAINNKPPPHSGTATASPAAFSASARAALPSTLPPHQHHLAPEMASESIPCIKPESNEQSSYEFQVPKHRDITRILEESDGSSNQGQEQEDEYNEYGSKRLYHYTDVSPIHAKRSLPRAASFARLPVHESYETHTATGSPRRVVLGGPAPQVTQSHVCKETDHTPIAPSAASFVPPPSSIFYESHPSHSETTSSSLPTPASIPTFDVPRYSSL